MFIALNKYYRPLTKKEFLKEMDIPMVNDAIQIACFPEGVADWIWEKERKPFEIFSRKK